MRRAVRAAGLPAWIAGLLLVGGLGVRLIGLTEPPLDSAVGRQFHSAFLARVFFLESQPAVHERQVEVARAGAPRLIEPPVVEVAAAGIYHLAGGEVLWAPRLLSIIAWTLGALVLYSLAQKLGFRWGAAAAVAVMVFLPFAVQFSRNFQPETIMVPLMIAAMWAMVRYDHTPSPKGMALLIALTAAAGFIKPVSLFVLYGIFAAFTIQREGWGAAIRDRWAWLFAILAAMPAFAWAVYGFSVAGFLVGQEDGRILPQLLLQPAHWVQTARLVLDVVTPPLLAVALIGLVVVPAERARTFAIGAFAGYAAFMMVFTYHTATHNYYHLQLVPLVALAVASCVDRAARHLTLRRVVTASAVVAVPLGAAIGVSRMIPSDQQLAMIPVAEQVGRVVGHSTRTVSVVERPWPPRHLWYYGYFAGRTWFLETELSSARTAGAAIDAEALLKRAVRARDRYLVIFDRSQIDDVPGLWRLLRSRYRLLKETRAFVVFDLARKPAPHVGRTPVAPTAHAPASIRHEIDSRQESSSARRLLLPGDADHGRVRT